MVGLFYSTTPLQLDLLRKSRAKGAPIRHLRSKWSSGPYAIAVCCADYLKGILMTLKLIYQMVFHIG